MSHAITLRVYIEDTDLGGIVYYANYFKFIERARSEMIREHGIDQMELADTGVIFAVRKLEADYILAAKYDDILKVYTSIVKFGGASFTLNQWIERDGKTIFEAKIVLACMTKSGSPQRIPAEIRQKLTA